MAETALTLEISSDGVIRATGNLNKFVAEANKAAASSTSLESSADTASQSVSSLGDNAKKAADNVKKEGDNAKKTADDVKKAGDSAKKTATYTNDLNDVLSKLNNLMSMAGVGALAAGLGKAAQAVGNFAKQAMGAYSSFEQLESGLEGLTGSAEAGKALFEDLRAFSFDTTFGVDTLAGAASQLMNVGVQAGDLREQLGMLGDIAGGDTNKFNELTEIYSKIINMGKAGGEQLGQLALRGVPIQQMLQQMGVEGTASAADITEAFRRMTEAGGQFHGAMERINDTIQGKQGFIADTWREFLTSTVEATGAADAYRSVLDTVYNVLQGVVNVLQTINKHPIVKAILQGIFAAALGALVGVILSALIPALVATIAKLSIIATLKTAINPVAGVIGLVAGAAITGGIALAGMAASAKDTADELANATDKALGYADASKGLSGKDIALAQSNVDSGNASLDDMRAVLDSYAKEIDAQYKQNGDVGFDWRSQGAVQTEGLQGEDLASKESWQIIVDTKQKYDELLSSYNKAVQYTEAHNVLLREQQKLVSDIAQAQQDYADAVSNINSAYANTKQGKLDAKKNEIAQLKELLSKGVDMNVSTSQMSGMEAARNGYHAVGTEWYKELDAESREKAKALLAAAEGELKAMLGSVTDVGDALSEWQRLMRDAMQLSTPEVVGRSGGEIANVYFDKMAKQDDLTQRTAALTGVDAGNTAQANYEGVLKVLTDLMSSGKFDEADQSIQALVGKLGELKKEASAVNLNNAIAQMRERNGLLTEEEQRIADVKAAQTELNLTYADAAEYVDKVNAMQAAKDKSEALASGNYLSSVGGQMTQKAAERYNRVVDDGNGGFTVARSYGMTDVEKQNRIQEIRDQGYSQNRAETVVEQEDVAQAADSKGAMIGGAALSAVSSAAAGTDAGNFAQGFAQGGIFGAILNTLLGAIMKICQGFSNFDTVMNAVTTLLQRFAPILQAIFDIAELIIDIISSILDVITPIITAIATVLKVIIKVLRMVFNLLQPIIDLLSMVINFLFGWLDVGDDVAEQQDEEAKRLEELNKQMTSLKDAMAEQEEYYLSKRRALNAEAYSDKVTGVNDMIITPQGNFSTHPDDYIIAAKDPSILGGHSAVAVQVVVNNNSNAQVSAEQRTDASGMEKLIINISQRVAGDLASGKNGWDGAMVAYQTRQQGRAWST